MFTIVKFGSKIPLVTLDDELDEIVDSKDAATKKLIAGFIEHGFPVMSRPRVNASRLADEVVNEDVVLINVHIFQEFLQNNHGLDIIETK